MSRLRYRYPGPKPFNFEEREFFFGRKKEEKEISRLLDLDKLVVLHSPSGFGKSSLINAGILPNIKKIRKWSEPAKIFQVRFTNYSPDSRKKQLIDLEPKSSSQDSIIDPLDKFISKFITDQNEWDYIWKELIPMPRESFWLAVKWKLAELSNTKNVVIVLDQFEELFTYPDKRVEEFARQLGELYYQILPESVREGIERRKILSSSSNGSTPRPAHLDQNLLNRFLETIEKPLQVKILISMRSDKLSYLERFKPYLPELMLSSYELKSFSWEQAEKAIVKPADLLQSGFASPRWVYEDDELERIRVYLEGNVNKKNSLSRRRSTNKTIEPWQLQIVCQHIEKNMIKKAKKAARKKSSLYRFIHDKFQ